MSLIFPDLGSRSYTGVDCGNEAVREREPMNVRTDMLLDKAQFLVWAERQEHKYELVNGRVVLQPPLTRGHGRICTNIVIAFHSRLDTARFDITRGDFAIETGERSVRCADIMVEPRSNELSARSTTMALVLVEVLSPSIMHVDFHEKLDEYRALPELGAYFICAQDEARVWAWMRTDGAWAGAPLILEGLDAALELPVLGIALPLAEIYRNIVSR